MYIVLGIVALLVVVWVLNPKAFSRLWESASAQVGKGGRAAWSSDPVAIYQNQVDQAAEEINEATRGLEQYQGLVASLERQVETGDKESARLTARMKSCLENGQEDRAVELGTQLSRIQKDLETNRSQLEQYREAYQNNLRKIKLARQRIADAQSHSVKLKAELKMSKAEAEVANLAQKITGHSAALDGLAEVEREIQQQIDTNRAKSRVAADLSGEGIQELEALENERVQEGRDMVEKMKRELGMK